MESELTVDFLAVQLELLTEHVQVADGDVDAEQVMGLVHVLHSDVEANIAGVFVRDVAISFHAETVVDIHRDFVTN